METSPDAMDVFAPIRSLDVRSLAGPALDVQVPAGSVLVHEGRLIGTFFVIRSGSADLVQGERKLATLRAGDCFGEIDPMALHPQRFSVIASTQMRVLTFSAYGISRLCAAMPGVRARLQSFLPDEGTIFGTNARKPPV